MGASAAATNEAVQSGRPDPLLEEATQLCYQLMHASRVWGVMIDWAVGVVQTAGRHELVVTSSEGCGFVPRGVFLPRSARLLFGDPGVPEEFRHRWFSYANPAETMMAYLSLLTAHRGGDIWALAVSTTVGGSAAPAQSAGVPHVAECSLRSSAAIPVDTDAMPLDAHHVHRLEAIDPGLYARLTGQGGRLPDRSEAWRTTTAAADTALSRAGALPDVIVPAIIGDVLDMLSRGLPVPPQQWAALAQAHCETLGQGTGLRPGLLPGDDQAASPQVRAYHDLSRLMELLLLWDPNTVDGPAIKHPEIAYTARHIAQTPHHTGE